jgi:hypothetical protein
MKRFLPFLLLAAVVAAVGCDTEPDVVTETEHSTDHSEAANGLMDHDVAAYAPATDYASAEGGLTASAFPSETPPTDKPSVTPHGYWIPVKEHAVQGGHGPAEH